MMALQFVSKSAAQWCVVFSYGGAPVGVHVLMVDYPVVVWQIDDATGIETPVITANWPTPPGSPDAQWQPAWVNYFEYPPGVSVLIWPDHYREAAGPFFDWMATANPSGGAITKRQLQGRFTRPLLQQRWDAWATQNPSLTW
jgi:hypothetical protein